MYTWFIVHTTIACFAVSLYSLFLRLVVFTKVLDVYCRFALFLMSIGKIIVQITYSGSLGFCVNLGVDYESEECAKYDIYKFLKIVHAVGEFLNVGPFFVLVCDRLASILLINSHTSNSYNLTYFILMGSNIIFLFIYVYTVIFSSSDNIKLVALFTILFVFLIAFGLVTFLTCRSKTIYYRTQGKVGLAQRFRLSQSYELSKSLLPPILIGLVIKIILIFSIFLFYTKIIVFSNDNMFYQLWNLCLNLECFNLPLMFLYLHKTFRQKVRQMMPFGKDRVETTHIRTLTGKTMEVLHDQEEYFVGLQEAWK